MPFALRYGTFKENLQNCGYKSYEFITLDLVNII